MTGTYRTDSSTGGQKMIRETTTENGAVRGIPAADPRITAFKGIPFAAPPAKENRWRAPVPAENWEGVLDCARFGKAAMQPVPGLSDNVYTREWHVDPEIPMGEDCLQLNIWTPAKTIKDRLPVFVFLFGGGLQCGYPSEMEFDGERIARRGIVVVTANYRVGVFGFLALPELTKEAPDSPTNFGLLDQQAALRWVRRNIDRFGGDPGNVTLGGQSAGGGSVLCQMANPENSGLFHRALIMSALIADPYNGQDISRPEPLWAAEEHGRIFLSMLGVDSLEKARSLPADIVQTKYEEYCKAYAPMVTVQDGRFLREDPISSFYEGKALNISVMAGNTSDEFLNFLPAEEDRDHFVRRAQEAFGEKADAFLQMPEANKADYHGRCGVVNGIALTAKQIFRTLGQRSDRHFYYYCFMPDMPGWDQAGTFHSSDLWFFFETLAKSWRPFTGRHYDLARAMCNYLCAFISNGDPNSRNDAANLPEWKPYTREYPCEMHFTGYGPAPQIPQPSAFETFLMDRIGENLTQNLPLSSLMHPVWRAGRIFRETFLCAGGKEEQIHAPFLYAPTRILEVTSYDGRFRYEAGHDYMISGDQLVLTPDSRIPHTTWSTFYLEDEEAAERDMEALPFRPDFGLVKTTDGRFVTLRALAHPEYTTKWQVCVTYDTDEVWRGSVPAGQLSRLPKLSERLRKKQKVNVVLYGDSIACGFDCSGMYGLKPQQPAWGELLREAMERSWPSEISFSNTSRGGADSLWAIQHAQENVCRLHPDLVILAWGMNDHCTAEEYQDRMRRLIASIHGSCPDAELVLVTTTLPNALLGTPPIHFWDRQDLYGKEAILPIEEEGLDGTGQGIVIADMQAVHREIRKHKRFGDTTANWLNHPNDFLARVYAQVLAEVLECGERE